MGRRRYRRRLSLWLLVTLVAVLGTLWLARVRLATDYIDGELARRGVRATYELRQVGLRTQILENLVVGDPRRPDATARRVEVELQVGLTGPRVGLITARGVRLRGQIVDGRLTLGEVDKLLPPPSGAPFRLPDQRIDIADAALALQTPVGPVAIGLRGSGNLSNGFRGHAAALSPSLRFGSCMLVGLRARLEIAVSDAQPRLTGPAAAPALRCDGSVTARPLLLTLDIGLSEPLDHWRGQALLRTGTIASGSAILQRAQGRVQFAGGPDLTDGEVHLEAASTRAGPMAAQRSSIVGRFSISPRAGQMRLVGSLRADELRFSEARVASVASGLRSASETPVGPVASALARALMAAARGGELSARLAVASGPDQGRILLEDLVHSTQSGARLTANRLEYDWKSGRLASGGEYSLSGGGFPRVDARLGALPSGSLAGIVRVGSMRAGRSSLTLAPIRLSPAGEGTRFTTQMLIEGPFADGEVTGLWLPVEGRFGPGGFRVGDRCTDASFRSLAFGTLHLGPTRLPLCPLGPALLHQRPDGSFGWGARIAALRLSGRLGSSPMALAAGSVRLSGAGASADAVSVRLGPTGSATRLEADLLTADFAAGGVAGRYAGLAGRIANVPLAVSDGQGQWRFAAETLTLAGRLQVADVADPPRFYPERSDDFRLTLRSGRIEASGTLVHPATGTRVADARISHDLGSGVGRAKLDVPGIRFGELQPEALTRLSTGVVALVEGTVSGRAEIAWDSQGTRSTGTFATENMNLAAPFGPVEGLTTELRFTDLLGLTSAPGQVARVRLVRPGIDVYDGTIQYQLLPNYVVGIEGARWPYAGGTLILQPTRLDFSQPTTKYLTFQVDGIDAARFITQMEFSNISATGTFDGIVPMTFDASGGRIAAGRLAARAGGGTLSYVGELTDRELGIYGKVAFDALKELRYDRFEIGLDGALDGEFVTVIDLDGIARNPAGQIAAPGGAIGRLFVRRALQQLGQIPFEFNIRIAGPFRALLGTARSFEDPTLLIQPALPRLLRDLPTTVTPVQDEESENER